MRAVTFVASTTAALHQLRLDTTRHRLVANGVVSVVRAPFGSSPRCEPWASVSSFAGAQCGRQADAALSSRTNGDRRMAQRRKENANRAMRGSTTIWICGMLNPAERALKAQRKVEASVASARTTACTFTPKRPGSSAVALPSWRTTPDGCPQKGSSLIPSRQRLQPCACAPIGVNRAQSSGPVPAAVRWISAGLALGRGFPSRRRSCFSTPPAAAFGLLPGS